MTSTAPIILPKQGMARVKNVLSGDTVVLLGKPVNPSQPPPEVVFTFESLSAPVSELRAVSFSASEDLSDVNLMQFILYTAIGKQDDPCG